MTQPRQRRTQTVQDLIEQLFQVATEQRDDPLVSQVETTSTQVLRASPARIAFTMVNLGGSPVFLWSDSQVSLTRGLRLGGNGGTVTVLYETDFARVGYEWWAIASGAASEIAISEELIAS